MFIILRSGLFPFFSPSKTSSPVLVPSRAVRSLAAQRSAACSSSSERPVRLHAPFPSLHLAHTARSLAAALRRVTQITISSGAGPAAAVWRPRCALFTEVLSKELFQPFTLNPTSVKKINNLGLHTQIPPKYYSRPPVYLN